MDAGVAVAVRDVQLTVGRDRQSRRPVERASTTLDRQEVRPTFRRVARIAWLVRSTQGPQEFPLERERSHGVVRIIGAVHHVAVDGDAVGASEDSLAPRSNKTAVPVVDDDRVLAPIEDEHPIL